MAVARFILRVLAVPFQQSAVLSHGRAAQVRELGGGPVGYPVPDFQDGGGFCQVGEELSHDCHGHLGGLGYGGRTLGGLVAVFGRGGGEDRAAAVRQGFQLRKIKFGRASHDGEGGLPQEGLVQGIFVIAVQVMAEPSAGRVPEGVAGNAGHRLGMQPDVGVVVADPARGMVQLPCRVAPAFGQPGNHLQQRALQLAKIQRLRGKTIHLGVDVQGIVCVPGGQQVRVPQPLQVHRLAPLAGGGNGQIARVVEQQRRQCRVIRARRVFRQAPACRHPGAVCAARVQPAAVKITAHVSGVGRPDAPVAPRQRLLQGLPAYRAVVLPVRGAAVGVKGGGAAQVDLGIARPGDGCPVSAVAGLPVGHHRQRAQEADAAPGGALGVELAAVGQLHILLRVAGAFPLQVQPVGVRPQAAPQRGAQHKFAVQAASLRLCPVNQHPVGEGGKGRNAAAPAAPAPGRGVQRAAQLQPPGVSADRRGPVAALHGQLAQRQVGLGGVAGKPIGQLLVCLRIAPGAHQLPDPVQAARTPAVLPGAGVSRPQGVVIEADPVLVVPAVNHGPQAPVAQRPGLLPVCGRGAFVQPRRVRRRRSGCLVHVSVGSFRVSGDSSPPLNLEGETPYMLLKALLKACRLV